MVEKTPLPVPYLKAQSKIQVPRKVSYIFRSLLKISSKKKQINKSVKSQNASGAFHC